jgi:nitrous oxide reductase accessory protein NosL
LLSGDEKKAEQIKTMWVKDYQSGQWLHAEDATIVVGSAILGPMGKELIPFARAEEAAAFQVKNGGSILPFTDITPDTLATLMGGMNSHHMMGK